MFGIGFSEVILLALVAIVLIKPDDLPAFFRKAGKFYGKVKAAYKEVVAVKDDFIREMEVGAALGEASEPAKKSGEPVATPVATTTPVAPEAAEKTEPAQDATNIADEPQSTPEYTPPID
jgi:sec-independent protein translocase protein TatB